VPVPRLDYAIRKIWAVNACPKPIQYTDTSNVRTSRHGSSSGSSLGNLGVAPTAKSIAIGLGGFMTNQQHREALSKSSPGDTEPTRGPRSALDIGSQQVRYDHETDKGYYANLRNLQQYICELLIKNQQLRSLLESATNHHYKDLFDD
jgi:hypothetical protein